MEADRTILFADVVDSTGLTQELGHVASRSIIAAVLGELGGITRSVGGSVVKTIGDRRPCGGDGCRRPGPHDRVDDRGGRRERGSLSESRSPRGEGQGRAAAPLRGALAGRDRPDDGRGPEARSRSVARARHRVRWTRGHAQGLVRRDPIVGPGERVRPGRAQRLGISGPCGHPDPRGPLLPRRPQHQRNLHPARKERPRSSSTATRCRYRARD